MNEPMREREREVVHSGRSGPSPALIAFVVVAVLTVIFVLTNRDETAISLYGASVDMKEWLLILISIAAGVVLDRLISFWWRRSRDR